MKYSRCDQIPVKDAHLGNCQCGSAVTCQVGKSTQQSHPQPLNPAAVPQGTGFPYSPFCINVVEMFEV